MERTQYMQQLMTSTYSGVAVEAVLKGFDGAWERLIAARLEKDAAKDRSEAVLLLESVGGDSFEAAKMVLSSEINN